MARNRCLLTPEVNGEPSLLYQDLEKRIGNRAVTNLIYAHYLQQGVAALMDSLNKKRDRLGLHSANDVYEFFGVGNMMLEATDVLQAKIDAGATDSSYNTIAYNSAVDALNRAIHYNLTHSGMVASVTPRGDHFEIQVHPRDSRSNINASRMEEAMKLWDQLDYFFRQSGMDLLNLSFANMLVNPLQTLGFVQTLQNDRSTRRDLIPKQHYLIFFEMSKGTNEVQRLINKYGSVEDAALKVWEVYRGQTQVSWGDLQLIDGAVTQSLKYNNLDLNALVNELNMVSTDFKANSEDESIETTLKELNKKYGIDTQGIHLGADGKIETLGQATARMVLTLERQIRELEREKGNTTESRLLSKTLNLLLKELQRAKFGNGAAVFMQEADKQLNQLDKIIKDIDTSGSNLEVAISTAKAIAECLQIIAGYDAILDAMLDIDLLTIDGDISDTDKATLRQEANRLLEYIRNKKRVLDGLKVSAVKGVAIHTFGDTPANGLDIANLIRTLEVDGSSYDFLYSIGTVSDPLVAAWGGIIREAQDTRSKKLSDISLRIRRATHALYKAGLKSEFMYDKDGRIISDIDWDGYFKARKKAIEQFKKQNLRGFDLKEAIESWEEANTEDRMVDFKNKRTERVPDSNFRKAFPQLKPAELEYYDAMMLIKGEMGTLLPKVAQLLYIPPLIRRSTLDALKAAKNATDVFKAIWHKVENIWKIREDDTSFIKNGIINGEEYNITEGDFEGNPIRRIPIFYVNRMDDLAELLKDFSGAIQHFAGMALSYEAMNSIKDLVEVMGDYIKNDRKPIAKVKGTKQADAVRNLAFTVTLSLAKKLGASSSVQDLIDGMLAWHIYGERYKDEDSIWTRLTRGLVNYSSIKGLALNLKGAIANFTVGELLMIIEAASGEFYNPADYVWAHKWLFGGPTEMGRVMGIMTNDRNSKEYLLSELFDPINESFSNNSKARYHRSLFRQLLGGDFTFLGYSSGEYLIHYTNMYAMLHNLKVWVDGKRMNLYDAFTVSQKVDGNSELVFKGSDVRDADGNVVDEQWLQDFRRKIRYVNLSTHGAMNEEDKGIFHRTLMGKLVMNFRQWMVNHYSRRYRAEHWDSNLKEFREGYWRTYLKLNLGWLDDLHIFHAKAALHWKDMSEHQKANVRRAIAELVMWGLLVTLSFALGEPDEHKKEFWYRMLIYQAKRAELEVHGSTPTGALIEAKKLINSPIPSLNTFNGFLYPVYGLHDMTEKVKRGPHKEDNLYLHRFKKYSLPFYRDIQGIKDFDESDDAFNIFNTKAFQ